MNKTRIALIAIFSLTILAVTWSALSTDNDNWTPLYTNKFSSPFSTQFLFELLNEDINRKVREIPAPLADYERINLKTKGETLVIINGGYNPDQFELELLKKRVNEGMNLFIAARPGPGLTSWLGLTSQEIEGENVLMDYISELVVNQTLLKFPGLSSTDEITPEFRTEASFLTVSLKHQNHQDRVSDDEGEDDTDAKAEDIREEQNVHENLQITWLAKHNNKPIFARIEREDAGTVWLLTSPLLLSNYHIWNPNYEATTAAIISHMPDTPLLWDEYYKPLGPLSGNPLSVMLDNRALSAAWFSMLSLTFLFLMFRVKRTQRPVPVVEPPKNATLNYLEKVSTLFQQKDKNLRVLDERILYMAFLLDLDKPTSDEAIIKRTAQKHRLPENQLRRVMRSYSTPPASHNELKELNSDIDKLLKLLMNMKER